MQHLLDDDSLCEIFRYLSVRDQLCLTAVCERFRDLLVERVWRGKFNKFTTKGDARFEELNSVEYQTLYRLIAPHIRELTIHNTACVAFTSYLGRYTSRPDLAFYFHFEYPNLRVLRCYDQSLHGGHLASLVRKCPQLMSLRLSSSYVNGEHIAEMCRLRELDLTSNKLEPQHFRTIFENLQLARVHLSGQAIDVPAMEAVLHSVLPRITELRQYDDDERIVTCDYFGKNASELRTLSKLYCKRLTNFIYSLHTLRELHFEGHVELEELMQIIENNPNLEQLYLGLNVSLFARSQHWVRDLVDRVQRKARTHVLTIYLDYVQKIITQLQQSIDERSTQGVAPIKLKKLPIDPSQFPILISKTGIEFVLDVRK